MVKSVFVIDDEEAMRIAVGDLLSSVGYEISLFGSAKEFMEIALTDPPGCLVLDIRLPGISGLDFQRRLIDLGITIPIVFMTGHGDIRMTVQAMKAGAHEFLTKPFRDQDLLDAVATALERDAAARERREATAALERAFASLTKREHEIMRMAALGQLNKVIAANLGLSEVTVKVYRSQIMRKMGANSIAELARFAERLEQRISADRSAA